MSGLAQIYHHLGYKVTGSDIKETYIGSRLKKIGIKVNTKHSESNVFGAESVGYLISHKKNNVELRFGQKKIIFRCISEQKCWLSFHDSRKRNCCGWISWKNYYH